MADDVAPALLVDALRGRQHGQPLPPQLPFAIHDANVFAVDPSALYNEYWSYAADDGSIYLFSPGLSTESQWRTATAARSISRIPSLQPLPPLVQRRQQHQVGLEGQFNQMCSLR